MYFVCGGSHCFCVVVLYMHLIFQHGGTCKFCAHHTTSTKIWYDFYFTFYKINECRMAGICQKSGAGRPKKGLLLFFSGVFSPTIIYSRTPVARIIQLIHDLVMQCIQYCTIYRSCIALN